MSWRSTLKTGKEVWRTKMADVSKGVTMTGPRLHRRREGVRRQFGWRDGRIRLDRRARPEDRQGTVARLLDRQTTRRSRSATATSRSTRSSRARTSALKTWPARHGAKRRRRGVGVLQLRSRNQPDLLRHVESRPARARRSVRATICSPARFSRATPIPARRSGPTSSPRTTSGITTASTR